MILIEKGKFKFSTEVGYFKYVMNRYFRKFPPVPTNLYLNSPNALNLTNRIKIASICHFPSIVNTLAHDKNHEVRAAAFKNDFWTLVGELQDVLGFDKNERREFARREVFRVIHVLLMFEDDLEVIKDLLRNASISTMMLTIYIDLLEKRGRGKKDQQILQEAKKVLAERKQRIIKAAEIRKAHKDLTNKKHQQIILIKLADEDKIIRKAITNILLFLKPAQFIEILNLALTEPSDDHILQHFIIMTELVKLIAARDDLRNKTIHDVEGINSEKKDISIAEYFSELLNNNRMGLLDRCQQDLTKFQHLLILATCHQDTDDKIQQIATDILSLDDIFTLVNDISTPQDQFRSILTILSEHPDQDVQKRVIACYHAESERLWNRLKELEQSINAYFDIIFQSLGFTQINEFNISIKTLEQAEKTINNLVPHFNNSLNETVQQTGRVFIEIKKTIELQIYNINADTSPKTLKELYHIEDIVRQIFELKNIGREGLRPGVMQDIDPELLAKAHTIWQSALGPFLGRIKHLNEMIKIKFSILATKIEQHENLQRDFIEVVETFEAKHKAKINCQLNIVCNQCSKRGCASERFLTETEFFIRELLDNFVEE